MDEKQMFYTLENYCNRTENEELLIRIQGRNPIESSIKQLLKKHKCITNYYIFGEYIFDIQKVKNVRKDDLEENIHFFHVITETELENFEKNFLLKSFIKNKDTENEISQLLIKGLLKEEQQKVIEIIISANSLKGMEKYKKMKEVKDFFPSIENLNKAFKVNKNFYRIYENKEKGAK